MNNQKPEHELYLLPGTNLHAKPYMQRFVSDFTGQKPGLYVFNQHYVRVSQRVDGELVVCVLGSDFYRKTGKKFKFVHEDGFTYYIKGED